MMNLRGADAMLRPEGEGYALDRWQTEFLAGRSGTIWGGTAQVQRNIVGERVLGLPKEPGSEQ
jgi:alkylation response protein AidB-like acyl-CoA dehydrogenase